MQILFIHLSDIHFKKQINVVSNRVVKFCDSFRNLAKNAEKIFLIVSGDVSETGDIQEFKEAEIFFNKVKNDIAEYTSKNIDCVVVPGNHDCNYTSSKIHVRDACIDKIKKEGSIQQELVDQCCEVQSVFFGFSKPLNAFGNTIYQDNLLTVIESETNKKKIRFNCYNTAWISEKDEKQGTLLFQHSKFKDNLFQEKADVIVSVLHHPHNWYQAENGRAFFEHLNSTSDIIMTGHEHIASKRLESDFNDNFTTYIEGAIFQGQLQDKKSEFNIVTLDLAQEKYLIEKYHWKDDLYLKTEEGKYFTFKRGKKLEKKFKINNDFLKNFLENLGAKIRHPKKENLKLKDIFVFPDFIEVQLNETGKNAIEKIVHGKELLESFESEKKLLILGDDTVGRTSFCNILFRTLHKKGYIPIYLDGHKINTSEKVKILNLIDDKFCEQYEKELLTEFKQTQDSLKVLIIDDFNHARLNPKYKAVLLKMLNERFENIVITGNKLFQLEEMFYDENAKDNGTDAVLKEYKQLTVNEFGHVLRDKLINKWNILGIENEIENDELIRNNTASKAIIDSIIGKNYVPSHPLFLLTILQAIEEGMPLALQESSYGYYYQYLITQALEGVKVNQDELALLFAYLSELANHFYIKKTKFLTFEELNHFHKWYCKEYSLSKITLQPNLDKLIDASILTEHKGAYRFTYKYIYYFFASKFLADNITSPEIKIRIQKMCERLYFEEFANIIVFLAHHSKNPFIIQEVLNNAKKIFPDSNPIKLESDVESINKLIEELPSLVLENVDIDKKRRERFEEQDKMEKKEQNDEEAAFQEYDIDTIKAMDSITELNVSFKILEILGQICKNYYADLKGVDKLEVMEEAYSIGLRALSSFFSLIEKHHDFLVSWITAKTKEKSDAGLIKKNTNLIVFMLTSLLSLGFIKKISNAVGSEKLLDTFDEMLIKQNTNSVNLIDVSIRLDYFKSIPFNSIEKCKKRFDNNLLCMSVLRELVRRYMYMFDTDATERQKIARLLNFTMQEQRRIGSLGTQKS